MNKNRPAFYMWYGIFNFGLSNAGRSIPVCFSRCPPFVETYCTSSTVMCATFPTRFRLRTRKRVPGKSRDSASCGYRDKRDTSTAFLHWSVRRVAFPPSCAINPGVSTREVNRWSNDTVCTSMQCSHVRDYRTHSCLSKTAVVSSEIHQTRRMFCPHTEKKLKLSNLIFKIFEGSQTFCDAFRRRAARNWPPRLNATFLVRVVQVGSNPTPQCSCLGFRDREA